MTSRGGPAGRARIAAAGALAFVTVIILVLTLTPTGSAGGVESFSFTLRARGFRGLADSLANILLFAPFGAAVAILRPGWLRPILAGAAMSLAIELAQLFVPGRYTSPWDVIFNTAGAAVGVTIVRYAALWLRPSPAVAAALAAAATLTGLTVLLAGPMLFAPATLPGTLVGQWTHVYEDAPRYDGRILEARVGDIPVYAWPVQQSRQLRAAMFRDTVVLKVVAGPPPDGAAPLFGIAAPDEQGLFNLAVSSDDVILGYRMHARRVGLDQPDVRARGILAGIAPGDTFALRTWRHGAGNCIELRPAAGGGAATSASAAASGASGTSGTSGASGPSGAAPGRADGPHTRTFCHAGFTAADTWALLLYPVRRPLDTLLPVLW
ncbi:MAG TPA: VanZ family protein, partial [Longimicrobiales bacterium]|nr:VanZ family protein [Longimicrobiales bacterium]